VAADDPRIGQVLQGRYRIIELIDTGTMGTVYRGERLQLGRQVAIKFLHPQLAKNKEFLARFEHEARAMSRLAHPHCVGVLDFGVSDSPYVVMEYALGETLKDQLRRAPITPPRAVAFGGQILAGLAHAHAQNIIHRDIKPANLIFSEATGMDDQLRIVDFGLAKVADFSAVSNDAIIVGTPDYMSPEQAQGKPATVRSDIYAVGVVLFEMLSGQKPFGGESTLQVIRDRAEQVAPSVRLTSETADISPELDRIVQRAMATDPDDRFESALEFGEALAATPEASMPEQAGTPELLDRLNARMQAPQSTLTETVIPLPGRRRWSRLVWPLAAVLALGAGLLGWVLLGRDLPQVASTVPAAPDSTRRTPDVGGAVATSLPARDAIANDVGVSDTSMAPDVAVADQAVAQVDPQAGGLSLKAGIRRAQRLAADDDTRAAIKLLADLRERYPNSAYLPYMQGNLYAQRKRWSKALRAYQAAIVVNSMYRKKAELIRNIVAALASRRWKTRRLAAKLITEEIGNHAVPYLRAAQASRGPRVQRREIARLLRKLSPPKPAPRRPAPKRKKRKTGRR
jgi:serine/threonine-protein kinase